MARVKTTARTYRLGCGCVHEFSSLPAVGPSPVLCASCLATTVVAYRYPDASCGISCRADTVGSGVVKVRCTNKKAHKGRHFDASVSIEFDLPDAIRARREGNT